jgi:glycosyltransferase involved in cell wall biosynthesis
MSRLGVTIVIPNWNHELCLPRSVGSALAALEALRAEGCPGEVLVIDDQSRDGSVTLLRQLEALHFSDGLRVHALARNRGLAGSRNRSLELARFRYIVFLDADNELVPANVPCLWQALRHTGAAAAHGSLVKRLISSSEAVGLISNEPFQDRIYDENYIDALAMLDREQVPEMGAYVSAYNPHEDYELWLHLADNGRRIVFVPVVFGYYYVLPNSMNCDHNVALSIDRKVRRAHDQLGARKHFYSRTRHLRYHPAVGYC